MCVLVLSTVLSLTLQKIVWIAPDPVDRVLSVCKCVFICWYLYMDVRIYMYVYVYVMYVHVSTYVHTVVCIYMYAYITDSNIIHELGRENTRAIQNDYN